MANPYLPKWEYIPDGEPRVFGDRVYIYGSHDISGSDKFGVGLLIPVKDDTGRTCIEHIIPIEDRPPCRVL